jgi:hypothetical protein
VLGDHGAQFVIPAQVAMFIKRSMNRASTVATEHRRAA